MGTDELLQTEPAVVGNRSDYRAAAFEEEEGEESIRTFEIEASLRSIDFRFGEKWRVSTAEGTLQATIDDLQLPARPR